MNAPTPPVKAGDIVAGKYRVDRILGMGGMGVVVAATHIELLETRALKFLLPSALANAEAIERFLREARAASRLKSEHVARVHDVGKLEDGAPYMVMEYLDGYDLGAAVKQYGAIPLETAIFYVLQAMEALAEAHAAGIIHRDLKPANLFLTVTPDGIPCVKVLDFGISKISDAESNEIDMTKTHAVLGSPQFMSPEQMHSSRNVDVRADIWSLGVILYQLSTGKLPFRGRSVTEIVAIVLSGPPPPPSTLNPYLPPGFDTVVLRCLRLNREERFPSIGDLAAALAPFAPASAAYILDRIARVMTSFVRKSISIPAAPTSAPGLAPSPYVTPPLASQPPAALGPTPNPYAQPAPITALPGVPPGSSRHPTFSGMAPMPPTTATATPLPYGTNVNTTPYPVVSQTPSLHGYHVSQVLGMSAPPPTSTSPIQIPPTLVGQTFPPPGPAPQGTVTGAWGGTQATSLPASNRAVYVLSAVIALSVVVLVVLQFLPTAQKNPPAASATPPRPSATVTAPDKPPPVVPSTTTAPPADSAVAPTSAPTTTNKKKGPVGDPFGTQRR